jgi:hypothetical protein
LFSDVTIAGFLASDETLFHAEFPFSWCRNDRSVLEGLIDSVMIDRKAGKCLLLDWKTKRCFPKRCGNPSRNLPATIGCLLEGSHGDYRPQVQAGLFSTALGRLLLYSAEELRNGMAPAGTTSARATGK